MKINERIKKLRLEHNLTQEDLAKICLVTRNAVSKWETDKGYPNLDSMILMCKYFNSSAWYTTITHSKNSLKAAKIFVQHTKPLIPKQRQRLPRWE